MNKVYTKDILSEVFGENGYFVHERLYGGMMNISYLIGTPIGQNYILYVPNGKANKLVNRQYEKEAQNIAYKRGVTSRNIYFDLKRGIKINEYIEGISLDKADFPIDYQKVADLLHILHGSKKLCPNDYNPFQRLSNYVKAALAYQEESRRTQKVRDFFSSHIQELETGYIKCVCHNDAQKSNIIAGEIGRAHV